MVLVVRDHIISQGDGSAVNKGGRYQALQYFCELKWTGEAVRGVLVAEGD